MYIVYLYKGSLSLDVYMVKRYLNTKEMSKGKSANPFDKNTSMGIAAFDKNTSMGRLASDETGEEQDNFDGTQDAADPTAFDEENQASDS